MSLPLKKSLLFLSCVVAGFAQTTSAPLVPGTAQPAEYRTATPQTGTAPAPAPAPAAESPAAPQPSAPAQPPAAQNSAASSISAAPAAASASAPSNAELSRLKTALAESQASLAEARKSLETTRAVRATQAREILALKEAQVTALQSTAAAERKKVTADCENALAALRRGAESDVARLREEHAATIARMQADHTRELAEAKRQVAAANLAANAASDTASKTARAQLDTERQAWQQKIDDATTRHEAALAAASRAAAEELEKVRAATAAELAAAQSAAAEEKSRIEASAAASLQEAQAAIAAAQTAAAAETALLRKDLADGKELAARTATAAQAKAADEIAALRKELAAEKELAARAAADAQTRAAAETTLLRQDLAAAKDLAAKAAATTAAAAEAKLKLATTTAQKELTAAMVAAGQKATAERQAQIDAAQARARQIASAFAENSDPTRLATALARIMVPWLNEKEAAPIKNRCRDLAAAMNRSESQGKATSDMTTTALAELATLKAQIKGMMPPDEVKKLKNDINRREDMIKGSWAEFSFVLRTSPSAANVLEALRPIIRQALPKDEVARAEMRLDAFAKGLAYSPSNGQVPDNSKAAPGPRIVTIPQGTRIHTIDFGGKSPTDSVLNQALSVVRSALADMPDAQFEIIGHSETGDTAAGGDRSQLRANIVSRHLIGKGVASKLLHATGAGSQKPLDTIPPSDKHQRRVEILLRPATDMAKAASSQ